jgi:hypothetical protein
LAPVALATALGGCVSPDDEDLHDEDLRLDLDTSELLMDRGAELPPSFARELEEVVLTRERLGALPDAVRQNPDLARYAVTTFLDEPRRYDVGVLGSVGRAKVFVAPSALIKDDSRLYWVEVKLLSEGYGCFIAAKRSGVGKTWVRCRDGRQVVFWRHRADDWISFRARQFDAQGYEIQVKHRRIERVSSERVI